MSRKLARPPIVEVSWLDAVTYTEPCKPEDVLHASPLCARVTLGYLIVQTDEAEPILRRTILARTVDNDGELADRTVIPTGWIKGIRYVTRKRKKQEKTT